MQSTTDEGDIDEWICSKNQNNQFSAAGDVMVDEAPPHRFIHLGVRLAIDSLQQETFEDVEAYYEVYNKYYTEYESTERC